MTHLEKPQVLLFDWDDTLIDCWAKSTAALNATLVEMGHKPWTPEEFLRRAGPTARELFPKLFGDRWEEAERFYHAQFVQASSGGPAARDGVAAMLEFLRAQGLVLGVVSNKRGPMLQAEAEKLGWARHFSVMVGGGDAAADKPHADPVFLALRRLGVEAGPHVWFVGDSFTDMICAHASGCTPVLVESKPPPADMLAQHPPALRVADCASLMEFIRDNF